MLSKNRPWPSVVVALGKLQKDPQHLWRTSLLHVPYNGHPPPTKDGGIIVYCIVCTSYAVLVTVPIWLFLKLSLEDIGL
jgi:hypothetical protein